MRCPGAKRASQCPGRDARRASDARREWAGGGCPRQGAHHAVARLGGVLRTAVLSGLILTQNSLAAACVRSKQDAQPRNKCLHVRVADIGVEGAARNRAAGQRRKAIARKADVIVLQAKENIADNTAFDAGADEPTVLASTCMRTDARCRRGIDLERRAGVADLAIDEVLVMDHNAKPAG